MTIAPESQKETPNEALMALWEVAEEAGIEYRDILHHKPVVQAEMIGFRLRSKLSAKRIEIARIENRIVYSEAVRRVA